MPKKKNHKKEKVFRESELGMILEENREHFKILREGQELMWSKFKKELERKIKNVEVGLKALEVKVDAGTKKSDTGFKIVMKYLSRLENENLKLEKKIKNKIDKGKFDLKDFYSLEREVVRMRVKIREFEKILKKKRAKAG